MPRSIDEYPSLFDSNFGRTKKRLGDLFMGRNKGGLGYVVPLYNLEKREASYPDLTGFSGDMLRYERYWDKMVELRLIQNGKRVWGHDWGVPFLDPNFHLFGIESVAYGSKYSLDPCGTRPVCRSIEDLDALQRPTLESEPFAHALSFMRHIDSCVQGKMPVLRFSINGPLSACCLIVDSAEFLASIVLDPGRARGLMREMTNLYIAFISRQRELVRNLSLHSIFDVWWPEGCCAFCEDDTMINLSPAMFNDLCVPYYNRISDIFGGVGMHCDGDNSHLFETMRDNIRNLRCIWMNAGECSFKKAAEVFRGTGTVIIVRWVINDIISYSSRIEFIKDILKSKPDDTSVFIQAQYYPRQEYPTHVTREDEEDTNIRGYELMSILERYSQYGIV